MTEIYDVVDPLLLTFLQLPHKNIFFDTPLNNDAKNIKQHKIACIQQSFPIIQSILRVIVHLENHMFEPSQIRAQHVYLKDNIWGVTFIVCGKKKRELIQQWKIYMYKDEANFQGDCENQIMWNLGKLWYQILFGISLDTFSIDTKQVERKIDLQIQETSQQRKDLKKVLKNLLLHKNNVNRMRIVDLLNILPFLWPDENSRKIEILLLNHLRQIRSNKYQINNKLEQNPILEHFLIRNIEERECIDELIDECKQFIKEQFSVQKNQQFAIFQDEIMLTCHIINIENYFIYQEITIKMKSINIINRLLPDLELRFIYCKFMRKKYSLQTEIQANRQKIISMNLQIFKPNFTQAVHPLQNISYKAIYTEFKNYVATFHQMFTENLHFSQNSNNIQEKCLNSKNSLNLVLLRTLNYVFNSCRSYLFGAVIQGVVKMKKVLAELKQCQNIEKIEIIRSKIENQYFKAKGGNPKLMRMESISPNQ